MTSNEIYSKYLRIISTCLKSFNKLIEDWRSMITRYATVEKFTKSSGLVFRQIVLIIQRHDEMNALHITVKNKELIKREIKTQTKSIQNAFWQVTLSQIVMKMQLSGKI